MTPPPPSGRIKGSGKNSNSHVSPRPLPELKAKPVKSSEFSEPRWPALSSANPQAAQSLPVNLASIPALKGISTGEKRTSVPSGDAPISNTLPIRNRISIECLIAEDPSATNRNSSQPQSLPAGVIPNVVTGFLPHGVVQYVSAREVSAVQQQQQLSPSAIAPRPSPLPGIKSILSANPRRRHSSIDLITSSANQISTPTQPLQPAPTPQVGRLESRRSISHTTDENNEFAFDGDSESDLDGSCSEEDSSSSDRSRFNLMAAAAAVAARSRSDSGGSSVGSGDARWKRSPRLKYSHKMAERKRRREMKHVFEELRNEIPSHDTKQSKWEILSQAVAFIDKLTRERRELALQKERLARKFQSL